MTHWSTINVDVTADIEHRIEFESRDSRLPEIAIQEDAHQLADSNHLKSAHYNGSVAIEIIGNRDWSEDLRFAQSLHPELWDRCVIVHANNTDDLGTARLYSGTPPKLLDEYQEQPYDDERMQGEKAAAVMYAEHNFPCQSTFREPHYFQE